MIPQNERTVVLTEDEYEWLRVILCWGAEVTGFLTGEKPSSAPMEVLPPDKDWTAIQYDLYRRLL